jgi:hypothetical protein
VSRVKGTSGPPRPDGAGVLTTPALCSRIALPWAKQEGALDYIELRARQQP